MAAPRSELPRESVWLARDTRILGDNLRCGVQAQTESLAEHGVDASVNPMSQKLSLMLARLSSRSRWPDIASRHLRPV